MIVVCYVLLDGTDEIALHELVNGLSSGPGASPAEVDGNP